MDIAKAHPHIGRRLLTAAATALALATAGALTAGTAAVAAPAVGSSPLPWPPVPVPVHSPVPPAAAGVDLAQQVSDYVAPFRAGASYVPPSAAQRATIASAVTALAAGRADEARRTLAGVGWTTTLLRDSATGRLVVEAADASRAREAARGWGRVYVDASVPRGGHRYSVEVPHPVFDRESEKVAAAIFRDAPGGVLIVAGAHRGVVDPAHVSTTVFAAVADGLRLPAVQVHGFAASALPGFDAIPSPGAAPVSPGVRGMADAIAAAGFRVCRVWERSCGALGGTTNVESGFAAAHGVPFLHLELAPALREDSQLRSRLAAAVAAEL